MNKIYTTALLLFFSLYAFSQSESTAKYFGRESMLLEGTTIPDDLKESPYDRLPASYKTEVRTPVWNLSKNSAGLSLRFISNSTFIRVKWELLADTRMNHMAETGIKGVDLYTKENGVWKYVNTGRPSGKENEATLVAQMSPEVREYRLYLPLYDGVSKVEIGVDPASSFTKPEQEKTLPVIFYGTSITQGGCASRPGMAYPAIVSRKMNIECVNLGFSGNGKMETPINELLANTRASFFVIDCLPNMKMAEVRDSVAPLVESIRAKHPATPIVFAENAMYSKTFLVSTLEKDLQEKNRALRTEYEKLVQKGVKGLYYIDNSAALGDDGEGTVDGVHLTDLGFLRYADHLVRFFRENKLLPVNR